MADNLDFNPIYIDSTGTKTLTGTGRRKVTGCYWHGGTATHTVTVKDTAGNVIWEATCTAEDPNPSFTFGTSVPLTGLVITWASGILLIYTE